MKKENVESSHSEEYSSSSSDEDEEQENSQLNSAEITPKSGERHQSKKGGKSDIINKQLEKDGDFRRLRNSIKQLKETPDQSYKKYYYCNIMKTVKVYETYGSFGELALLTNKRRKAKLETIEDTHFAILSKQDYRQAQGKAQNALLKEKTLFLKNFDLFAKLSESNLVNMSQYMEEEKFSRG